MLHPLLLLKQSFKHWKRQTFSKVKNLRSKTLISYSASCCQTFFHLIWIFSQQFPNQADYSTEQTEVITFFKSHTRLQLLTGIKLTFPFNIVIVDFYWNLLYQWISSHILLHNQLYSIAIEYSPCFTLHTEMKWIHHIACKKKKQTEKLHSGVSSNFLSLNFWCLFLSNGLNIAIKLMQDLVL